MLHMALSYVNAKNAEDCAHVDVGPESRRPLRYLPLEDLLGVFPFNVILLVLLEASLISEMLEKNVAYATDDGGAVGGHHLLEISEEGFIDGK